MVDNGAWIISDFNNNLMIAPRLEVEIQIPVCASRIIFLTMLVIVDDNSSTGYNCQWALAWLLERGVECEKPVHTNIASRGTTLLIEME